MGNNCTKDLKRLAEYKVEISGAGIVDKHTHYEAHPFVGPERATVIIRGDIATDFQKRYGLPIIEAEKFQASVDLGRNDQRVRECQDVFKPASHLMGSIGSLDDIVYQRKQDARQL